MEREQVLDVITTPRSLLDSIRDKQAKGTIDAINQFQAIAKNTLKEKYDYGIIPGTGSKPTLLKPGADKLIFIMGLATSFEFVDKTRDFDNKFFDYVMKCKLYKNGELIAEGIGSANNKEPKFVREDYTNKQGNIVEPAYSMDNNVLKMAKKRALVDAALQVGCLSDVFTQDFDDLPQEDITGNKAEQNSPERQNEQPISLAQAKRIFALSKGNNDLVAKVLADYKYIRSTDVLKKDYEDICYKIESGANA
jgi:hypothetical protein